MHSKLHPTSPPVSPENLAQQGLKRSEISQIISKNIERREANSRRNSDEKAVQQAPPPREEPPVPEHPRAYTGAIPKTPRPEVKKSKGTNAKSAGNESDSSSPDTVVELGVDTKAPVMSLNPLVWERQVLEKVAKEPGATSGPAPMPLRFAARSSSMDLYRRTPREDEFSVQHDPRDGSPMVSSEEHHSRQNVRQKPRMQISANADAVKREKARIQESLDAMKRAKDLEENKIAIYLDDHELFLNNYVLDKVPLATFERWYYFKAKSTLAVQHTINNKTKFIAKQQLQDLNLMSECNTVLLFIWELANTAVLSMKADAFSIYKIKPHMENYFRDNSGVLPPPLQLVRADEADSVFILEAARRKRCMYLTQTVEMIKLVAPGAFFALQHFTGYLSDMKHGFLIPVLDSGNITIYVIRVWRTYIFDEVDHNIGASFTVWSSFALSLWTKTVEGQRKFLDTDCLTVARTIFEDMATLDQVIKRILTLAQKLVNADRASLFLVDSTKQELVSTVFDLKFDEPYCNIEKKEIRIPIKSGIAGHVAISGESMNIANAYADPRFNREVDESTGYKTTSILCMPVKIDGRVIGVVQMVNNRKQTTFSEEDEESFEIFSTLFGLALHHAKLYDKIMHKEQKYRVALEVLTYHTTCRSTEVQHFLRLKPFNAPILDDFALDPFRLTVSEKCQTVITMFDRLFDMRKFDLVSVVRFLLTVKKNYRDVPYHNFDHGWSVAQTMYAILMKDKTPQRFRHNERLALFVASLCHDLDHRGYTNKYTSETASPLAAIYTTSTLEHHHFNITVMILQQDGHNIFSHFSSEEYKDILSMIRFCILATDLAVFFPNLARIQSINKENRFDWRDTSHRELVMAMSMTASDLSASAKPWAVQLKTVRVIFQEFYEQGDKEKSAGKKPIPMMDRNKPEQQPSSQVQFFRQICIPCYVVMEKMLPETKGLLEMASNNLSKWQMKTTAEGIRIKLRIEKDDEGCISLDRKNLMILSPVLESLSETSPSEENDGQHDIIVSNDNACSTPDNLPASLIGKCNCFLPKAALPKIAPSPKEPEYLEATGQQKANAVFLLPPILPEIGEPNKTIHPDIDSTSNSKLKKSVPFNELSWFEDEDTVPFIPTSLQSRVGGNILNESHKTLHTMTDCACQTEEITPINNEMIDEHNDEAE